MSSETISVFKCYRCFLDYVNDLYVTLKYVRVVSIIL